MKYSDVLQESFLALTVNKVRSGLTVLGIVIGIASVIALVAIGQGAKNSIENSIQSIGSNLLLVTPGAFRGGGGFSQGRGSSRTLTPADAAAISTNLAPLAQAVAPEQSGRYQIVGRGTNTNTQVIGTEPVYPAVRNLQIAEGSFVTAEQVSSAARVAVLGPTARDDLFGSPDTGGTDPIGQTVRIKNVDFKVIGVTVAKGGSGFTNPDDSIYVPVTTAERFLAGATYLTTISVQAQSANDMTTLQQEITDLLLRQHKISDPTQADFSVINQADIVATASSVTNTFTLLLAAIAGISLVVGGIGIMNMMLTTVTERTREIGLRKAIGARKWDISIQFLTEAVMLTFASGGIGILAGWGAAIALSHFVNIKAQVSLTSVILAFGVSTAIGIVFGFYPARRAADLNPIQALRYE
jgi:putative ABC transport system permease protein